MASADNKQQKQSALLPEIPNDHIPLPHETEMPAFWKKYYRGKGKIHFLMIAAMLSPMLLLSLRILKILKGDDPTPLGILLSCIFMSIAVVKYGLFDPVKNAKNYIIDNLKEAVIVTDADHRFLFLNSMADKIITSINKEQGYSTDDKIYAFIQGSQDFLTGKTGIIRWKKRY